MARRRPLIDRLAAERSELNREGWLARILCGEVRVGDSLIRDPRYPVSPEDQITIVEERYVGRGALKLEHAIETWNLPVAGKVFLDAGASTGGFTDCLLQHGAAAVHAVDVGTNQLAYRLRRDSRVYVREHTNIRDVTELTPQPDAAVADLSFRSLSGVAGAILDLVRETWAVVLIKPQFEWDSAGVEFDGVVPSEELGHIVAEVLAALRSENAPAVGLIESPITGRKGNREFLALLDRSRGNEAPAVRQLVEPLLG